MLFKWGRLYSKNGIEYHTLYETSKEAIRDVFLGRMLNTSSTIGIVNLKTMEVWENEKLEKVVSHYSRRFT